MDSRDIPFVSGMNFQTQSNCKNIRNEKEAKINPPPNFPAKKGKNAEIKAAKTQWVELPKAFP
jgi:hypothetical protein